MAATDTVMDAVEVEPADPNWPNAPMCPFDDEPLERQFTTAGVTRLWCPWCECLFDPSAWIDP